MEIKVRSKFNPITVCSQYDWKGEHEKKNILAVMEVIVRALYCENCDTTFFWFYYPGIVELKGNFPGGYGRLSRDRNPELNKEIEKIEAYRTDLKRGLEREWWKYSHTEPEKYDEWSQCLLANRCPECGGKIIKSCIPGDEGVGHKFYCYMEGGVTFHEKRRVFLHASMTYVVNNFAMEMKETRARYNKEGVLDEYWGKEEAEEYINECKRQISISKIEINPERINCIKGELEELSKYVWNALEIERNVYSLEERIKQIIIRLQSTRRYSREAQKEISSYMKERNSEIEKEYELRIKQVDRKGWYDYGLQMIKMPQRPTPIAELTIEEPQKPLYKKAGLFNKKKVEEYNINLDKEYQERRNQYELKCMEYARLKKNYEDDLEKYENNKEKIKENNKQVEELLKEKKKEEIDALIRERDQKRQEMEAMNAGNTTLETVENEMVSSELEEAKEVYIKLLNFREQYYSPDIIFGKYRDLAALSTIYEYFQSGRCTELAGPNGAYNLYESELRSDLIIEKLDVVIEKLDEIRKTQYTLCDIMSSVSDNLRSIDDKMAKACSSLESIDKSTNRIVKNTDNIAKNTAVTAYYAEKTAYYSKINATVNLAAFLGL